MAANEMLFVSVADRGRPWLEKRRRQRCPEGRWKDDMKAMFVEPLVIVASSLLWIIVLPFAVLVRSGIAISDRVGAV